MARRAKPWYWEARDGWYVTIDGQRHRLADGEKNRARADQVFHALMAERGKPTTTTVDLVTGDVVVSFLEYCEAACARGEIKPVTFSEYRRRLRDFFKSMRTVKVADLRPIHVTAWLDQHPIWGTTWRHGIVTAIKRAFRWARQQGLISADPLLDLSKPRPKRRELVPNATQVQRAIDGCVAPEFRDFLTILWGTGCRRSEAIGLTADQLDLAHGRWVAKGKTTARTGKQRVVYLTPELVELCGRLARRWPTGPILRNTQGNPWKPNAINWQICRLRKRTGLSNEVTCHGLRHLFATDALSAGVPIATVAELLGHQSTAMISKHYSHLADRQDVLRSALDTVRPRKTAEPVPASSSDESS